MTDTAPAQTPESTRARPAVLRLWSPSAAQILQLIGAVLTAGLFAGNWLHNATADGDAWLDRARECWTDSGGSTWQEQVRHQQLFEACMAGAERQRAVYAFGGLVVAAIAACVVLLFVPALITRRRGLSPLSPPLAPTAERAEAIAEQMGVHDPPELLIGTTKLRDAFSFGLPRRYRIALPPKLAVSFRRPEVLDPVLAHELGHVMRQDVAFAWLARTVWYAIVPVLAVPFLLSAAQGDVSLAGDFLWRAVLLLGVVWLITAGFLRAREFEADLTAAHALGVAPVIAGLAAVPAAPDRRGLKAAVAMHPTAAQRAAVLDDVSLLARSRFLDGLTAGFLAGVATPLLLTAFITLLTGSGLVDLAHLATGMIAGGSLGVVGGLTAWRTVLVQRLTQRPAPRWRLALGVGAGLLLGDLVSLGQTATQGGVQPVLTWWSLVPPAVGIGATALMFGLAELWADGAPGRSRPPRAAPALAGALLMGTALTMVLLLQPVSGHGLMAIANALALTRLGGIVTVGMLGVALLGAWWMRARAAENSPAPGWLTETGTAAWAHSASPGLARTSGYGLLGGLTGGAAIVGYRALAGPLPAALAEERFLHYLILGAAVAAAVMLVLALAWWPVP